MKVIAHCCGSKIEIPCGPGKQHIRWLGMVTAIRYQKEFYPHAFKVPQRVLTMEGQLLRPRQVIHENLEDGEEVVVELRSGASLPEELLEAQDEDAMWLDEAYGAQANLMECKFRWKVDAKYDVGIPAKVRGDFFVAPKWSSIYSQKEYGGRFEIPLEPVEVGDGQLDWIASRKGPPGSCNFKFVMEDGSESVCKANAGTLTNDGSQHHVDFTWDVPIAPEPWPEVDSRPSTASSRDGTQVDPRFEGDWEAMRLRWVEPHMKVRVKDVLTEFYAILIDLFDSYAFMGLDLSSSAHSIGMDDLLHCLIQCGLMVLPPHAQPTASLAWDEVCHWFEDATGIKDGRPYCSQRLQRPHYLELLLRVAHWTMCEHPSAKYSPSGAAGAMPLDEGFFRFITDILIPVMDVYDDDPIRKDAVQHSNLIAIQQNRPSIRSMYSFLSQPWPFVPGENEPLVSPMALKFVIEYALDRMQGAEEGGGGGGKGDDEDGGRGGGEDAAAASALLGDDKLSAEQLASAIEVFDGYVHEVTAKHPEPLEERALLFWEFFEVYMQCCRHLAGLGTPLHEAIPMFTGTLLISIQLIEESGTELPAVTSGAEEEMEEPAA